MNKLLSLLHSFLIHLNIDRSGSSDLEKSTNYYFKKSRLNKYNIELT